MYIYLYTFIYIYLLSIFEIGLKKSEDSKIKNNTIDGNNNGSF